MPDTTTPNLAAELRRTLEERTTATTESAAPDLTVPAIDWPDEDDDCSRGFHGCACNDPDCRCDCHAV